MTHDEEMAARGRLVTEFSEAKKRLTILLHEANRLGEIHSKFGADLKRSVLPGPKSWAATKIDIETWAVIENPEKMRSLLKDIEETQERVDVLRTQVRQLGLD